MLKDPLTGVYSRATLESRLNEEVERSMRYHDPFTVILLDIDHFKSVNDAFGHTRGDRVLSDFAHRLLDWVRRSDIIFRYGGDEFLILLPNTPQEQALQIADRLLIDTRSHPFHGNPPLTITLSMGLATFPDDAASAENLFEKADKRHYTAKRRGRNQVVGFDPIQPQEALFDEDFRLLDRDNELVLLHAFLDRLPEKRRGLFAITGMQGCGSTRFLHEVGKVARLQGYEVLHLHGVASLKNRSLGSLTFSAVQWPGLPSATVGVDEFSQALNRLIDEKGRSGLMITVDNAHDLDWTSNEFLRAILRSPELTFPAGIAYSCIRQMTRQIFPLNLSLVETVDLQPLSSENVQIWLRSMLRWEAPGEFSRWLYSLSSGLPAHLKHIVLALVENGLLEPQPGRWVLSPDYDLPSVIQKLDLGRPLPTSNLPSAANIFIGRTEEIERAKQLLERGSLLTLIGPGGVGKTRLALQIAAEMLDFPPQIVYWIPFAAVESIDLLPYAIADALKFSFYSKEEPEIQLLNFLRTKNMLLVFDNFEHLIPGGRFIAEVIEQAPGIKIILTSRERLKIQAEAVLELQGLQLPEIVDFAHLESYPAIQLFLHTARRSLPDFNLTSENKNYVLRICQLVDGLPLGIELAAAWIHVLSCQEIAAEIAHNLDFLEAQMQDIPDRHRSLRAVFEHSWNLLLPGERAILSRLAIFNGSFTRDAATQIADATFHYLTTLLDKTLLRRVNLGRYDLHDLLRRYANEKLLLDPKEHLTTGNRHLGYFTRFVQEKAKAIEGSIQRDALISIGLEFENIRTSWYWAVEHAELGSIDQMLDGLYRFFTIRGNLKEGDLMFAAAENKLSSMSVSEKGSHQLLQIRLLLRRASINFRTASYDQSLSLFNQGIKLAIIHDSQSELAFGLIELSKLHNENGDLGEAYESAYRGFEIARTMDDQAAIGRAVNELGVISYQTGDFPGSYEYHLQALEICRRINDPYAMASILINLGNTVSELGEDNKAVAYYQESLAICDQIGALTGKASNYNNIGDIAAETGDYMTARQNMQRALEIYQQIGDRFGSALVLGNLAQVAYSLKEYPEAQKLSERALAISREIKNPTLIAMALTLNAKIALRRQDTEQARICLRQALENIHGSILLTLDIIPAVGEWLLEHERVLPAIQLAQFAANHPSIMKRQRDEINALATRIATFPQNATSQASDQNSISHQDALQQMRDLLFTD